MPNEPLIAVIDDDGSFRAALVEVLHSLGYEAQGLASADEFIAARLACDCVITDIHMPGMNGLDLARRLSGSNSGMPVIVITARTEPDLEAKVAASGAVCLLRKPFETDALRACLKKAFR